MKPPWQHPLNPSICKDNLLRTVTETDAPTKHASMAEIDWSDAYRATVGNPFPDARAAANALVRAFPNWMKPLFGLRGLLVAPFGLKGASEFQSGDLDKIGFFPVTSETEDEIVAGADDKHLDFRIIVTLNNAGGGQSVTCATIIQYNKPFGRFYLKMVLPFHRAIIKSAMKHMHLPEGLS